MKDSKKREVREKEILELWAKGITFKEISNKLNLSENTIRRYLNRVKKEDRFLKFKERRKFNKAEQSKWNERKSNGYKGRGDDFNLIGPGRNLGSQGKQSDETIAKRRAYRLAHKDEIKAYRLTYRLAHKDEIKAYSLSHKDELNTYRLRRKKLNLEWLYKYLGVEVISCERCGYNKDFGAIDAHHLYPEQKRNMYDSLGRWFAYKPAAFRYYVYRTRLAFLCRNCHRELEDGLWELYEIKKYIFMKSCESVHKEQGGQICTTETIKSL